MKQAIATKDVDTTVFPPCNVALESKSLFGRVAVKPLMGKQCHFLTNGIGFITTLCDSS